MIIVDNSSIDTKSFRIANKLKQDFSNFVEGGGVLVCLSSQPKNYGGYGTYGWLPLPRSCKPEVSKLQTKSLKIKRTLYERFIENQKDNLMIECSFANIHEDEFLAILLSTGLDEITGFSLSIEKGMVICIPQFTDKKLFLEKWLAFWISKKPDWVERFLYKEKEKLQSKLKIINKIEKLLYGNDRELRDAVIEALKILGFNASAAGRGTEQDIDLSCNHFVGIEVKGLKAHADRDDMRALLDYYDAQVKKQSDLKGIFVVNHYREIEPGKKDKPYTESALELAKRKGFCLLMADDLYFTLEKVLANQSLSAAVRNRIIEGNGLIHLA